MERNAKCTRLTDVREVFNCKTLLPIMLVRLINTKDEIYYGKNGKLIQNIFTRGVIEYSAICMAKNGKDTKHTRQIARRMHLVRNGEKCNMINIDWCEGGLQL